MNEKVFEDMGHKKIASQQKKILSQINKQGEVRKSAECNILRYISKVYYESAIEALGGLGLRMVGFVNEIDFSHPDLDLIYNSAFVDDSEFSEAACDLLDFANSRDLSPFISTNLSRVIAKHPQYRMLHRAIDAPTRNLLHGRFAKPEIRQKIRSLKQSFQVDLQVFENKGITLWEESPDDFSSYSRFSNHLLPFIEEATEQHKRLISFGLVSLASEIECQLEEIVSKAKDDKYYEFNRITMTTAAVILGKILDSIFDFNFEVKSYMDGEYIKCYFDKGQRYKPCIIPYDQMDRTPGKMAKLIDKLDNWPEANGHPIFDNFWIMIPNLQDVDYRNNEKIIFCDLIEEEKVIGVLLGEKDGDVFFVSYWM